MLQSQALNILKTGVNVFLTGEPGAGKTHTINEYIRYLRAHNIESAVTAATGIAATHLGGVTIHSWSGIGIKEKLDQYTLGEIATNKYVRPRVSKAKVLIIDEVSMLSASTLDMIDVVCRHIRKDQRSFGGLQVILVGDFFQLPPIVKKQISTNQQVALLTNSQGHFAYSSFAWTRANLSVCYLTEQYRQDDAIFLGLLAAIRCNNFGNKYLPHIEARKIEHSQSPVGVTKLFSHNVDVDRVNEEMLIKLSGQSKIFTMFGRGQRKLVEALKRGCLSPEILSLKVGAVVMFTKNNIRAGFVNGTLGLVVGFEKENGYPIVKLHTGTAIAVEPIDWVVEENGEVRAQITQTPLRLAWAITVHKSQGMSLDAAVMDLSSVFEYGQGYVALSRVRRLSGLFLLGWNERVFQVHPEVLKKDELFRVGSVMVLDKFNRFSQEEIIKQQNDFIVACDGQNIGIKEPKREKKIAEKKYDVNIVREGHVNAYRPWNEAQEEELLWLFEQELNVNSIAKQLGRKVGAIRSRLTKLGKL